MHAYEKVVQDEVKKNAIAAACAGIIEIEWNCKADPVGKFLEAVTDGTERLAKRHQDEHGWQWGRFHFMFCTIEEAAEGWKPYADDPDMKAALTAAWNHIHQYHLLTNEDYAKWVSFYHRDEEDPIDPPTITLEDLKAWMTDYCDHIR